MPRKTTSLKIDIELWKEVRKKCIDLDSEISDYLENLIRKDLGIKIDQEMATQKKSAKLKR